MTFKTIIITGPSAVGKTFLADELLKKFPEYFTSSKIVTTRHRRAGEQNIDRLFVDTNTFFTMQKSNEFIVSGKFGDNWYGYTSSSLHPSSKHILANTWPEMIHDFDMSHVVTIGLQTDLAYMQNLQQRMIQRGDDEESIKKRTKLIAKDIKVMNNKKKFIEDHGAFFVIKDDSSIPNYVLPFICNLVGLQA